MAQVLCFGEMLFDCLADQLGVPLAQVQSWTKYPGGAPANVACGLVKLGITSAFIGRLGTDANGQALRSVLAEVGVNLDGLQMDQQRPSRLVYVTRSLDGDRQFAGFGDYGSGDFADTAVQGEAIPSSLVTNAQYLVMGTCALAYAGSRGATERLVELAQAHGVKIFLDINWRPVFWPDEQEGRRQIEAIVPHADIVKCTDEEGLWLFDTQEPGEIQQKLPHAQGVLVTAGEKGCTYSLGNLTGSVPAFLVPVQDTTGAGDSFVAGFLQQWLTHGQQLFTNPELAQQSVVYASAVGALTTLKPGAIAAQPTAAMVEEFLQAHGS